MAGPLHFSDDPEANELLGRDPLALLVGFALDQQVTVQKAFAGPRELERRLGRLDARHLAELDPAELEEAFARKPSIHRFPGAMAKRVQDLARAIVDDYDGDASRVWTDATDGRDLERRLLALPGFGEMKVRSALAVLAKRLGVRPPGIDDVLPRHPTLGDVDSPESLLAYQAAKRAHKAEVRAAKAAAGD